MKRSILPSVSLRSLLIAFIAVLGLRATDAQATAWHAMDWIDGESQMDSTQWQQNLGIDWTRVSCRVDSRSSPYACVDFIKGQPKDKKYFIYVPFNTDTMEQDALTYSRLTAGVPQIESAGIDDFFGHYYDWYNNIPDAAQWIGRVIDNLKRVNPNLKFGITLYEDELDPNNSYIDDDHLPAYVKAKFDYIHLFLHFRKNGPQMATYIAQTKRYFPNATIIAGVYSMDRIDYIACSQDDGNQTPCSEANEVSLFKQALDIEVAALKKGDVGALELFPGYFGNEDQMTYGSGNTYYDTNTSGNNRACEDIGRCLRVTRAMRDMVRSAYNAFAPTNNAAISRSPSGLRAIPNGTRYIQLTWNPPSQTAGLTGYNVYRGQTLIKWNLPGTLYFDTSAEVGVAYTYTVASRDIYGNPSPPSQPVTVTMGGTTQQQRSAIPTQLTASSKNGTLADLSWTAPTDFADLRGYKIYRNGALSGTVTGTTFSDSGVTTGKTYDFAVRAYNTSGNLSDPAQITFTVVALAPPAPKYLIGAFDRSNVVQLTWTQVAEATLYNIYRSPFPGVQPSAQTKFATSSLPTISDNGVSRNQSASYIVTAVNASGESAPTNEVTVYNGGRRSGAPQSVENVVPLTEGLTNATVFPNPWRSDLHNNHDVTFSNLSGGSVVKIFTIAGRHVRTLFKADSSTTWDLKNEQGEHVASGLYFYLITNDAGQRVRGRLAVIR